MKIFLLEDDYSLNESITEMLEIEGYFVSPYYDGNFAFDDILNDFDLYILDINVPNVDGLYLLEYIKKTYPNANILIISANINIDIIKEAYTKGCEDYIKKPFDINELLFKINKYNKKYEKATYLNENTYFTKTDKKLYVDNIEIELTKFEKLLLILLVNYRGKNISQEQIENFVYLGETKTSNAIRSLVKRLRKKIPENIILNNQDEGYFIK